MGSGWLIPGFPFPLAFFSGAVPFSFSFPSFLLFSLASLSSFYFCLCSCCVVRLFFLVGLLPPSPLFFLPLPGIGHVQLWVTGLSGLLSWDDSCMGMRAPASNKPTNLQHLDQRL